MLTVGIECEELEDKHQHGVARNLVGLLSELARMPGLEKDFRFFLYFKSRVPDLPFLDQPCFAPRVVRFPLIPRKLHPVSFTLYYLILLPLRLLFEKLDLVFFPNYRLPFGVRQKTLVALTEDICHEIAHGSIPFIFKLSYRVFCGHAAREATKILAWTEASKKAVAECFHVASDRIVVNPHGVSVPVPETHPPLPITYSPYLLFVGNAFPRRHVRESMLAFKYIAPNFPGLRFIVVGHDKSVPPVLDTLAETINRELGREAIERRTYVSEKELTRLYGGAKAFIYISAHEAFGLPPLEALSYHVPAVIADTAVTREIFGENAFFVHNPADVDAIADVLADALTNREKRLSIIRNARGILETYSWRKHAERFLAITTSLTKKHL